MTDKNTSEKPVDTAKPVEKSAEPVTTQKSDLDRVVDIVGQLAKNQEETQKSNDKKFDEIMNTIKSLTEAKPKAMETPTDLPLEPKGNPGADDNDIGAQVKAPKDWYQSQSQQGSITEASKVPNSSDKPDLRMEQKNKSTIVTTETPRPSGIRDVIKAREASGFTANPILKEFRELGYADGVKTIAEKIRSGAYHNEPHAWSGF